uniref:Serine incorporator n=1 Tax=Mantoniella antarctica TaxID=81844 RepID=A0A7S0SFW4_9CHLO|mmetsp:Transcript_19795/g.49067  ORF Transcript_19795/g.49067 Transcript_19795/m.49067 type:complete len:396 (+) Transcript_19795:275-1462(+)
MGCAECCERVDRAWRGLYLLGFFLTLLASWLMRDKLEAGAGIMPAMKGCRKEGHAGCDYEVVTRISLGSVFFFTTLGLAMLGARDPQGFRQRVIHRGAWWLKIPFWGACVVCAFLIPPSFASVYFEVARIGAGLFLLIQLVILLASLYDINDRWLGKATGYGTDGGGGGDKDGAYRLLLIASSVVFYFGSFIAVGFMYARWAPVPDCAFNITVITFTILLAAVYSAVSMRGNVRAGLFTSGAMTAYCTYLCMSALASEPEGRCTPEYTRAGEGLEITGFIVAIVVLAVSAARAGDSHESFQFNGGGGGGGGDNSGGERDQHPFAASYFHLVFATASMYSAMLFVGWRRQAQVDANKLDAGWESTYVKIVCGFASGLLYLWTLVAPLMFPNRDFAI